MAVKMNKTLTVLALLALAPCGGCAGIAFEPTANWWRDGGRICAANRDPAGFEGPRAAFVRSHACGCVHPAGAARRVDVIALTTSLLAAANTRSSLLDALRLL